jgi:hypothetical protein
MDFSEKEQKEHDKACEKLKLIFREGPLLGKAISLVSDEIFEKRKPLCPHLNVHDIIPDYEALSYAKDVPSAIETFRVLFNRRYFCSECNATVYPVSYKAY